jgi:hypothetical protein
MPEERTTAPMVFVFYRPLVLAGHLAGVMHFLYAGQERETLLCAEEPMTPMTLITALFDHVDEQRAPCPSTPRRTSGPARWSRWGCSMPSREWVRWARLQS